MSHENGGWMNEDQRSATQKLPVGIDVFEVHTTTQFEPIGWYWRNTRDGILSPNWGPFPTRAAALRSAYDLRR